MCLGPEFFDAREESIRRREALGEREVCVYMRAKRLRFDLLYELGYFVFDLERGLSTTDFFIHDLAKAARKYFREDKGLQLIFVRPEKAIELGSRLRKGMPV